MSERVTPVLQSRLNGYRLIFADGIKKFLKWYNAGKLASQKKMTM